MCGIAAVHSAGRPVAARELELALSAMRTRGPDGRGTWLSADGQVGLAHARLAVTDVAHGAQPLSSEDGQVVAVVNGELYGATAQRAELVARGHTFRTRSDSELVVHLYEQFGVHCVELLRGEFAFVLYDARARRLVAARDRFGVKPLLYAHDRNRLALASTARGLFALGVPAQWDQRALGHALALQYTFPDETLFRDVRALEPGTLLVSQQGTLQLQRYASVATAREPDQHVGPPEPLAECVCAELEEAVALRCVADVPVAFHLSGGLDSTAVVALAARHVGRPHCFTLAFDDPAYDESAVAQRAARTLGAELTTVPASPAALVDAWPEAIAACEGFAINGHAPAKLLLNRAMHAAGYKVALTGEGSDEVFAGYAHLRADLGLSDRARLEEENAASLGVMLPHGDGLSTAALRRALGFVPTFLAAKAGLGKRVHSLLAEEVRAELTARDAYEELVERVCPALDLAGRAPIEQSMALWMALALPAYLLRSLGDGLEMSQSIEGRLPFLDSKLFALVRRIPAALKVKDGVEKWILRQALLGVVPEEIRARPKRPLLAPPFTSSPAMRAALWEWAGQTPYFDASRVRAVLAELPRLSSEEASVWDPALLTVASAWALECMRGRATQ